MSPLSDEKKDAVLNAIVWCMQREKPFLNPSLVLDDGMVSKGQFVGRKAWISMRFIGLAALIWFLIRVIPKPNRAAYPCQPTGQGRMYSVTKAQSDRDSHFG